MHENVELKPLERDILVGGFPYSATWAIRADEDRDGYISTKPNIKPVYPFKEVGITLPDVARILDDSGLGLPKYYGVADAIRLLFLFLSTKSRSGSALRNGTRSYSRTQRLTRRSIRTRETGIRGASERASRRCLSRSGSPKSKRSMTRR